MLGHHVQCIAGTRPSHPRVKIDPVKFVQHHSPHHIPEDNSRIYGWNSSTVSSPSAYSSAMSPSSNISSVAPSVTRTPAPDDDDTCWNLIPYDVPWGPDYYAYQVGSLPGPDGACLLLRSPTPLDKRRTVRACEKCRERKAKCSGDRPSCVRCIDKGRACIYTSDSRRTRVPASARRARPTDRASSSPYRRYQAATERGSPANSMSSLESSDTLSFAVLTPKQEDENSMPPLLKSSQFAESIDPGMGGFALEVMGNQAFSKSEPPLRSHSVEFDHDAGRPSNHRHVTGHGELVSLPPNHTSSLAPAIIAPKPMRCGPPPLSSPAAICDIAAGIYPTAVRYDPQACVDPSILTYGHANAPFTLPVELLSGNAAQHSLPTPMTAGPSASPYHPHLQYGGDFVHDGVSVLYSDTEIYEDPAARQLRHPFFVPYALHYRDAACSPAYAGSTLYAY
ncbi:hypothetical protein BC835DRAFT_986263 [Cytidiella melzeri]|nr:hypothetical protein BC835DRAFT_986263 [Cytidiella melzeri]